MTDTVITKNSAPNQYATLNGSDKAIVDNIADFAIADKKVSTLEMASALAHIKRAENLPNIKNNCQEGSSPYEASPSSMANRDNLIKYAQIAVNAGLADEVIVPDVPNLCGIVKQK